MAAVFTFPSSKAQVRAMSSANWAEVSGGNGLAPVVSKLETPTKARHLTSEGMGLMCFSSPTLWGRAATQGE